MDLLLFCTAFILQFVGHRLGDYFFQTHSQALNKAKDRVYRIKHCYIYSTSVAIILLLGFEWKLVAVVFGITFLEHLWIDSRTPVVKWKSFLERRIAGNKDFKIDELPFFVMIEIDQTIHYMRIFIISLLIGYGIL